LIINGVIFNYKPFIVKRFTKRRSRRAENLYFEDEEDLEVEKETSKLDSLLEDTIIKASQSQLPLLTTLKDLTIVALFRLKKRIAEKDFPLIRERPIEAFNKP
jgi:hypothetical protein